MLFDAALINPLVSPVPPINEALHILNPLSQQLVTVFDSSPNWMSDAPTLGGEQWQTTQAAIFSSFKRDFFRRLSYVAMLANEVQVEHSLIKLDVGLAASEVPAGVVLIPPSKDPVIINSLAVFPECSLRSSLKRRIEKAFESTGRGGTALTSFIADREYWAGVLDERFTAAHTSPVGRVVMVNRSLVELYPEWLGQRSDDPRSVRCVLLTLQLPLEPALYAIALRACEAKIAHVMSLCEASIALPGLQFYERVLPELTKLQNEYRITGDCAILSLIIVGDLSRDEVRVPVVALELREHPLYALQLLDGTTIEMSLPPWHLGQTIPPLETNGEFQNE